MSYRSKPLVHSVSVAEFDQKVGNRFAMRHPNFRLARYDATTLAGLCLPDGAHIHQEDWTYLLLDVTEDGTKRGPRKYLYGLAYYRNVLDKKASRGAQQKALLVLSPHPYFHIFLPLMRVTLTRYMTSSPSEGKAVLTTLFNALKSHGKNDMELKLWDESFPLNIPVLGEEEYAGISLIPLIRHFGPDIMLLWYALLMEERILFAGQPASAVGNYALAAPLLVAPLKGFKDRITPYVSLENTEPLQRRAYVCGTTNQLFVTKTVWYDVLASLETGTVNSKSLKKVSGADVKFIRDVIAAIDDGKGESWVRNEFKRYTTSFLENLQQEKLTGVQARKLANFSRSPLYALYLSERFSTKVATTSDRPTKNPLEILGFLTDPDNVDINVLEMTKAFFDLHKALEGVDLATIEELCDADGVAIVATALSADSAQVRKYSVLILSILSISIKGQIALLSYEDIIPTIIGLLDDVMPNVSSAACLSLQRISNLFIGVQALLECDIVSHLEPILSSAEVSLDMKISAASTLLQVYRFCPETAPMDPEPLEGQFASSDERYVRLLHQLFDAMGQRDIPHFTLHPRMEQHLQALKADDPATRSSATSYLLSDLVSSPEMVLQLAKGHGVELVLENERLLAPEDHLSRMSWAVLAIVADATLGRDVIAKRHVTARALAAIKTAKCPLYLYYVSRFLEVLCQHSRPAEHFVNVKGVETMVTFVRSNFTRPFLNTLCLPGLGALRHLCISYPKARPAVHARLESLSQYAIPYDERQEHTHWHEDELQDLLALVFQLAEPVETSKTGQDAPTMPLNPAAVIISSGGESSSSANRSSSRRRKSSRKGGSSSGPAPPPQSAPPRNHR